MGKENGPKITHTGFMADNVVRKSSYDQNQNLPFDFGSVIGICNLFVFYE